MGRSSRFPDLREFRARAARLGYGSGRGTEGAEEKAAGEASPMVWAWAAMGLGAAVLIGWTLLGEDDPDPAPGMARAESPAAPARAPAPPPAPAPQAAEARTTIDSTVAAALSRIDARIDGLDRARTALEGRQSGIEERVAVIEEAFGPTSGAIDAPSVQRLPPRGAAGAKADAPPASLLPPALGRGAAAEAPGATGALGAADGPIRFGIDLGGFIDLASLADAWRLLVSQNERALAGLTPLQVTRIMPNGARSFRLIAGPFEDIAEAGQACAALKARGIACSHSVHVGQPL